MNDNFNDNFKDQLKNQSRLLVTSGEFHRKDLMAQIQEAERSNAGLGFFINANMLDQQLSYPQCKEDIISYIADEMNKNVGNGPLLEDLYRRGTFVVERTPYLLRVIGSNTEQVIDWIKMSKGDESMENLAIEQTLLVKQMLGTCEDYERDPKIELQVVPYCFTIGGFMGQGRIPKKMRDRQPLVVQTRLCKMFINLQTMAEELREVMTDIEWSLSRPCPIEVLSFLEEHERAEEIYAFAGDIRSWWYNVWQEIRGDQSGPALDDEAMRELFKELEDAVIQVFEESEFNEDRPYVAAALMARIYTVDAYRQAPEAGETFPDGLLWIRPIAKALLEAFDMMGLSGQIAKIDFGPKFQALRHLKLDVRVVKGVVYVKEDGREIGKIKNVEDGDYTADGGLITIQEAHPVLQMESYHEKGDQGSSIVADDNGYFRVNAAEMATLKAQYESDPETYDQMVKEAGYPPFDKLKLSEEK